jgi:hypothetical protein
LEGQPVHCVLEESETQFSATPKETGMWWRGAKEQKKISDKQQADASASAENGTKIKAPQSPQTNFHKAQLWCAKNPSAYSIQRESR